MHIHTIAVFGSGVMGSGIAAQAANAGCEVLLYDIVPEGAAERSELAKKAIEKLLKSGGFTHESNASRVRACNVEDDLARLKDADWVIEAVVEKPEVKRALYQKIAPCRKAGAVVSSNTSTIPLHDLVSGIDEVFPKDFMIAHFFNPPRHMRLLETVKGKETRLEAYEAICRFADERLGKQVVECKDTPGFIANRIGVFWMVAGLQEALKHGITVEEADAAMAKAGIPKTGVFGLYDLIGLDLIPLIAKELLHFLPQADAFHALYQDLPLLKKLIAEGYTGRKGKGGFYRVSKGENGVRVREVLDLASGAYRPQQDAKVEAKGIAELVKTYDYAWAVLSQTLVYAASLIPEIHDDFRQVDEAMRSGYSWKMGPFEMIDAIGLPAFRARLEVEGRAVPKLLQSGDKLYTQAKPRTPGHLWLADIQSSSHPVHETQATRLWDMGEGIACLEFTTKMNAIDESVQDALDHIIPLVKQSFHGLVIGGDSAQFSVGANLKEMLSWAKSGDYARIHAFIERGQGVYLNLKYAPFPVVPSLAGLALGGGCELVLHADAIQAHIEAYPGLVETHVGLIPAWGGCKEMLLRHAKVQDVFDIIYAARRAGSAQEARDLRVLGARDGISMNRARVLADAKARALALTTGYAPPVPPTLNGGGAAAKNAMLDSLQEKAAKGDVSPHSLVIGRVLAHVLSGGEEDGGVSEQKLLKLELEGFMELVRTQASQERIAFMLENGKPLLN